MSRWGEGKKKTHKKKTPSSSPGVQLQRQLSSSTPASVYKQSHSCWHWYCICREEQRKPRLTRGLQYRLQDRDLFIREEVFVTPCEHSTCLQFQMSRRIMFTGVRALCWRRTLYKCLHHYANWKTEKSPGTRRSSLKLRFPLCLK